MKNILRNVGLAAAITFPLSACNNTEYLAYLRVDCEQEPSHADASYLRPGSVGTIQVVDGEYGFDAYVDGTPAEQAGTLIANVGRVGVYYGMPNPRDGNWVSADSTISAVCIGTRVSDIRGQVGIM